MSETAISQIVKKEKKNEKENISTLYKKLFCNGKNEFLDLFFKFKSSTKTFCFLNLKKEQEKFLTAKKIKIQLDKN